MDTKKATAAGLSGKPLPAGVEHGTEAYMAWRRASLQHSAAMLGQLGGLAGTGASKRRGDSDYYRALRAKRTAKAKGNASA